MIKSHLKNEKEDVHKFMIEVLRIDLKKNQFGLKKVRATVKKLN